MPSPKTIFQYDRHAPGAVALNVQLVPGCRQLRVYQTKELLRGDGQVVRVLIYFALRERGRVVELQNIEAVEADMGA